MLPAETAAHETERERPRHGQTHTDTNAHDHTHRHTHALSHTQTQTRTHTHTATCTISRSTSASDFRRTGPSNFFLLLGEKEKKDKIFILTFSSSPPPHPPPPSHPLPTSSAHAYSRHATTGTRAWVARVQADRLSARLQRSLVNSVLFSPFAFLCFARPAFSCVVVAFFFLCL